VDPVGVGCMARGMSASPRRGALRTVSGVRGTRCSASQAAKRAIRATASGSDHACAASGGRSAS
jgi:hypothetical protein